MNYEAKRVEIENEIKRLQSELETLAKTAKKEEWKKSLVEKFKEFLHSMDDKTAAVEIRALRDDNAFILNLETYFYNEPENTAKVETEPTAEPKAEEINEPENKFKIGDYVYYQNCGVYGEIIEIKDGTISIKEKDGNIYKVRPEWIYKTERPAEKPNETPEEKPVKMKMSLDELIKGME